MEYLASDKIVIIDLASSEITEEELAEDMVVEKIGGAGITAELYKRYEAEDPIVLGAGLLTGSLVPASALSVMTAKSPLTGKVCHVPLTQYAGIEVKYSGFDYVVIKGSSEKPVYLWLHDGIADLNDGAELWGKDVWTATDSIRQEMGDDLIQVLGIGKAGESGSDIAQVCANYWASGDRMGLGAVFGRKNLKLIAIRGMGLLEIAEPEDMVEACRELLTAVKAGPGAGKKGILDLAGLLGEDGMEDWIGNLVHRHNSCFNTPFATNTFAFLDEDPGLLEESKVEEPGFLLTDVSALLGFKKLGLSAADACSLLRDCSKYGIDGAAVAELSQKEGVTDPDAIRGSFSQLKGPVSLEGNGIFSPYAPPGLPGEGVEDAKGWERRQAVAYVFGIQPIFAIMCPHLSEEKLLELSSMATDLELTQDTLDKVVAEITGQ